MVAMADKTRMNLKISLDLDCGWNGEYTSQNVIGEITGRSKPDEVVVIGGHLDSWDLGTGAIDDGAGVAISMAAGHLIGGRVYFSKDVLKKLPAGEYYVHEIIGLDVYSDAGDYLGKIESVFPTGSNDVYVCRKAKEEILLPAISDVIKRIDLDQRIMTVKIPDGL